MFYTLDSLLFALFCTYFVKGSTKCADIFVKAEAPYFSFLKKNSEATKLFWSKNCDSSRLINFSPTNVSSPPLLCQTNGRNSPPTIKYPSISFLKGRKFGQMKESRTALYQRTIWASKRSCRQWFRTSSRSFSPTSVAQKHSDTNVFLCFVLLIKIWALALFYKTVPFVLTIRKLISLARGFSPHISKLKFHSN